MCSFTIGDTSFKLACIVSTCSTRPWSGLCWSSERFFCNVEDISALSPIRLKEARNQWILEAPLSLRTNTEGRSWSQLRTSLSTTFFSNGFKMLKCSTIPSVWGWWTEVRSCFMLKSQQRSFSTFDMKGVTWSVSISLSISLGITTQNSNKWSSSWAIVFVLLLLRGDRLRVPCCIVWNQNNILISPGELQQGPHQVFWNVRKQHIDYSEKYYCSFKMGLGAHLLAFNASRIIVFYCPYHNWPMESPVIASQEENTKWTIWQVAGLNPQPKFIY